MKRNVLVAVACAFALAAAGELSAADQSVTILTPAPKPVAASPSTPPLAAGPEESPPCEPLPLEALSGPSAGPQVLDLGTLGLPQPVEADGEIEQQNGDYPRNEGNCRIYGPAAFCCTLENGSCGCTPGAAGMQCP